MAGAFFCEARGPLLPHHLSPLLAGFLHSQCLAVPISPRTSLPSSRILPYLVFQVPPLLGLPGSFPTGSSRILTYWVFHDPPLLGLPGSTPTGSSRILLYWIFQDPPLLGLPGGGDGGIWMGVGGHRRNIYHVFVSLPRSGYIS